MEYRLCDLTSFRVSSRITLICLLVFFLTTYILLILLFIRWYIQAVAYNWHVFSSSDFVPASYHNIVFLHLIVFRVHVPIAIIFWAGCILFRMTASHNLHAVSHASVSTLRKLICCPIAVTCVILVSYSANWSMHRRYLLKLLLRSGSWAHIQQFIQIFAVPSGQPKLGSI